MGLDTKTYWLTGRQPQCDFHFDFDFVSPWRVNGLHATVGDKYSVDKEATFF
jgi:hypothetical protein